MCNNIFIIDDYSINLRVGEMVVRKFTSFDTISCYLDAQEALNFISDNQDDIDRLPEVILLDLHMPVMDGWQFLEKFEILRSSLKKDIKVYILSSSINFRDMQRAELYTSVSGFFSKPLTPDMVVKMSSCLASAV